jgi:hypothetical protein
MCAFEHIHHRVDRHFVRSRSSYFSHVKEESELKGTDGAFS